MSLLAEWSFWNQAHGQKLSRGRSQIPEPYVLTNAR
jgi:hypothetical protein